MTKQMLALGLLYVLLILVQVLICNHIMLFNVAVPFIYIYFIIRLPVGMSQTWVFTLAFLMGAVIDIFSDTPGVNALAATLLAAVKTPVFYAYVPRDDKTKRITPAISTVGWQNYSKYTLTMSALFCLMVFSIEFFSFASIEMILLLTACSSVLTFALILAVDSLMSVDKSIMA
ncbi:MAG: rod shape-determining protein MreD [Muribaculaceae bacterium]|nr:rod shape-determining protein MreD [Muribaculaceae bacterium]